MDNFVLRFSLRLVSLVCILSTGNTGLSEDNQVYLADGTVQQAVFETIDSNGRLVTRNKDGKLIAWNAGQVLRYGTPAVARKQDTLVLQNGSLLNVIIQSVSPDKIEFVSRVFQTGEVNRRFVKGILFRQSLDPTKAQLELDRILTDLSDQTTAILVNRDVIKGSLVTNTAAIESVSLKRSGFTNSIDFTQLKSLIFPGVSAEQATATPTSSLTPGLTGTPSESNCLGLVDGSRIRFQSIEVDLKQVVFGIEGGFSLVAPVKLRNTLFFERVCHYEPVPLGYRFLSSTSPLKVVDKSSTFHSVQRNRSCVGGPLVFEGSTFDWGLGATSNSQIIYSIAKGENEFRVLVALDDSAGPLANVDCRIVVLGVDNKWQSTGSKVNLNQKENSKRLVVNVSSARAIGLITSSAKHGTTGDRVNWLDARVSSTKPPSKAD